MKLTLTDIGKRFKFHWIFRHIDITIERGQVLIIKGPNGSGKSTLLKILSGFLSPSQGSVDFKLNDKTLSEYASHVTYAAPYVDLIEQLTLREVLQFHSSFKTYKRNLTVEQIIDVLDLRHSADKALKDFSSGMQQRVRLGLAILSEASLCILDEPSTNLDIEGFNWYKTLLLEYKADTAVIIASNEARDFIDEDLSIDITDYKKA